MTKPIFTCLPGNTVLDISITITIFNMPLLAQLGC